MLVGDPNISNSEAAQLHMSSSPRTLMMADTMTAGTLTCTGISKYGAVMYQGSWTLLSCLQSTTAAADKSFRLVKCSRHFGQM
jgi:hypothetical protein